MKASCLSPSLPVTATTVTVSPIARPHPSPTSPTHTDLHLLNPDPDPVTSKDTIAEKEDGREGKAEEVLRSGKDNDDEKNNDEKNNEDEIALKRGKTATDRQSGKSRKRSLKTASLEDCHADGESDSEDAPPKKRPLTSVEDSIHGPESEGLSVQQLVEHVERRKRKGLFADYAAMRAEPLAGTFHHSRARHNLPKNRYTDVLCFDHSRVKLFVTDRDLTRDYINANFVDGYTQKKAYIATQGPLPKTFADFWRMVWQQQCQVIVMTTRTVERQRTKCGQYWPEEEDTEEQFGEFVVSSQSTQPFNNYSETKLLLRNTATGESREVTHLQFTRWPDHGVPPAASFLDFLFHVRAVQAAGTKSLGSSWKGHAVGPPVVVHCSAGIGRSGTFITIDICLRRLVDTQTVDVAAVVRGIRSQRAFSIQTPEQFVFCHLAVLQHAARTSLLPHTPSFLLADSDCDTDSD